MNLKKRIILIVFLIIFIVFIFIGTDKLENHLKNNKTNIYKDLDKTIGYKSYNKNRYIIYYNKNKNIPLEDIVTYINIGLDKKFYEDYKYSNIRDKNLILVNKFNRLNKNYIPNDLEEINSINFINNKSRNKLKKEAKIAFEKLSNDSIKSGYPVYGQSAYRSYFVQNILFNNEVNTYGYKTALKQVAKPGFSEHQTGLAIDVSSTKNGNMLEFKNTPSYRWMKYNSYKYGFILRYPKEKEKIHGYIYEPWHYRYVGTKVSKDLKFKYKNLTYDEYYYKVLKK